MATIGKKRRKKLMGGKKAGKEFNALKMSGCPTISSAGQIACALDKRDPLSILLAEMQF